VVDTDGTYTAFFDEHGIDGLLARPDFYVFGVITHESSPATIVDDLYRLLTGSMRTVMSAS
jgi:hypothetical protein